MVYKRPSTPRGLFLFSLFFLSSRSASRGIYFNPVGDNRGFHVIGFFV
jgi:hypothetical protein